VDDLDRCPPERVVEVLQAVHLLLALPLFVVVVAADPRWLMRSLRKYFIELLSTEGSRMDISPEEAAIWASTPQHYLEKIFQIPFTLPPMDDDGYARLVDSLLQSDRKPQEESQPPPAELDPEAVLQSKPPPKLALDEEEDPGGPKSLRTALVDILKKKADPKDNPADQVWAPSIDLTPANLVVSPEELEFIKHLAPLIPTPRATKHFANIYRLIRATLSAREFGQLGDTNDSKGFYREIQILLGILIGFPGLAPDVFRALGKTLSQELNTFIVNDLHLTELESAKGFRNLVREWIPSTEATTWKQLCEALHKVIAHGHDLRIATMQLWCERVARYSFRAGYVVSMLGAHADEEFAANRDGEDPDEGNPIED
jgi:hypothetical protein